MRTHCWDFHIFLSHAEASGGAVTKLFKIMLLQRQPQLRVFMDSDNLVCLYELSRFVQQTNNLVLILTPGCYAREWVALEIVTSYLHSGHFVMTKVDGYPPPDDAFIQQIPETFSSDSMSTSFDAIISGTASGARRRTSVPWKLSGGFICRDLTMNTQSEASVMVLKEMLGSIMLFSLYLPSRTEGILRVNETFARMDTRSMFLIMLTCAMYHSRWMVVELAAAVVKDFTITVVQLDSEFRYPDEIFYTKLKRPISEHKETTPHTKRFAIPADPTWGAQWSEVA